ncbi:MAG: hypothetical protein CL610_06470 [Anaerolineaceae bacterium]|nr:hypothetical protein [Anaerolineaceae bacterium]
MCVRSYKWSWVKIACISVLLSFSLKIGLTQKLDERIVFMSDRDGNREIYTMNPDGTDIQRLTNHDAQDIQPTWSPDKSQIAFVSNRDGDFGIYVMRADGSGVRKLVGGTGAFYEFPSWSPDGLQIVYSSDEVRSFDLYVMNVNGGEPRRLTTSEEDETDPSWAPDGSQIVHLQTVEGVYQVFIISAGGGSGRPVLDEAGAGDFFSPRWSPDGTKLAYATTTFETTGSLSRIYIQDLADSTEHILTSAEDRFITGLSWSAESQELIYAIRTTQGKWSINRIDGDGEIDELLSLEDYNAETPSWSAPQLSGEVVQLAPSGTTPVDGTACAGGMASLFVPGNIAIVDFNASGALRILTNYNRNAPGGMQTIAQFYDNDRVDLLEGPVCFDSVNYWKIYYGPLNTYGWIAEGRNNDRFLCPESNPECS